MAEPVKRRDPLVQRRRFSVNAALDDAFFVFAGVAAIWLAYLLITEAFSWGWWAIAFAIAFWLLLAYLVLPRLHSILTAHLRAQLLHRARPNQRRPARRSGEPRCPRHAGAAHRLHGRGPDGTRADEITAASTWRIVQSTVLRRSYDEAPVSPLFLFGRRQDLAYQQEVEGNPAKRHHVRFWRCPEGWMPARRAPRDWVAAGTFDRAVGFSLFTLQVTHKIDADIDIERDHIVRTLRDAHAGVRIVIIRDFSNGVPLPKRRW